MLSEPENMSLSFSYNSTETPPTPYEDSGPSIPLSKEIWKMKYANGEETHSEAMERIAGALCDDEEHKQKMLPILKEMRFLPAGRVQAGAGSPRRVTLLNCFHSGEIYDSMDAIMKAAAEAAETMRMGGGVGFNFSNLRPRGDLIKSLDSKASGPVSFMAIFDAVCQTIASAGHRRGAMMGCLSVSHPDILEFIHAKRNSDKLKGFNVSVAVTDDFMEAVMNDTDFNLTFEGKVYKTIRARELWDEIMISTWDWAEPGILFLERYNKENNTWYAHTLLGTNPCGEIGLQGHGACLLGSFNLTKYVEEIDGLRRINYDKLTRDIPLVVRMMDNVNDVSTFPLEAQKDEAKKYRRVGIGVTGMANALEYIGYPYASDAYVEEQTRILKTIRDNCYLTSVELAKEKGPFPKFDKDKFCQAVFIKTLPNKIQEEIKEHGVRNSHLLSVAPTGTVSLCADNISSGIEPVFSHSYNRTIQTFEGPKTEEVKDYAYRVWGLKGRTADECSVEDHLKVFAATQKFIDQSVSKTCNVGSDVTFDEFKNVYIDAYKMGCKGITTFRAAGKRYGVLNAEPKKEEDNNEAKACFYDPATGKRECE